MFEFKLSEDLTRRIVANLVTHGIDVPHLDGTSTEMLRTEWGKRMVGMIGMFAQRARYELFTETETSGPGRSFCLIHNGEFLEVFAEHIGGTIVIPPDQVGDGLLKDLADELTARVKDNAVTGLHAQAPVTGFEVREGDVYVSVRPRDPLFTDPDFVQATVLE